MRDFFLVEAGKTYFSKTPASSVGFSFIKNLPPQNSSTGPVSYHYFGSAAFEITSRAFVLSSLSLLHNRFNEIRYFRPITFTL